MSQRFSACSFSLETFAVDVKKDASPMDAQFDKLAARFVDESPALSPIGATTLGDHRYDHLLDDVSEAARTRERTFCQRYLDELAKLDRNQLRAGQQVGLSTVVAASFRQLPAAGGSIDCKNGRGTRSNILR